MRPLLLAAAMLLAACGGGGGSQVEQRQLTVDLLRRVNQQEPTREQIDSALKVKDHVCKDDDTDLGFFAALQNDDRSQRFAADLLDIWCPDTARRFRSVDSSLRSS